MWDFDKSFWYNGACEVICALIIFGYNNWDSLKQVVSSYQGSSCWVKVAFRVRQSISRNPAFFKLLFLLPRVFYVYDESWTLQLFFFLFHSLVGVLIGWCEIHNTWFTIALVSQLFYIFKQRVRRIFVLIFRICPTFYILARRPCAFVKGKNCVWQVFHTRQKKVCYWLLVIVFNK